MKHYSAVLRSSLTSKTVANFFSKHPDKKELYPQDSCIEFNGAIATNGYARIAGMDAHKFSYVLFNGDIPNGGLVMHSCDNKPCINPWHLLLGNKSRNAKDKHGIAYNKNRKMLAGDQRKYNKRKKVLYGSERD